MPDSEKQPGETDFLPKNVVEPDPSLEIKKESEFIISSLIEKQILRQILFSSLLNKTQFEAIGLISEQERESIVVMRSLFCRLIADLKIELQPIQWISIGVREKVSKEFLEKTAAENDGSGVLPLIARFLLADTKEGSQSIFETR